MIGWPVGLTNNDTLQYIYYDFAKIFHDKPSTVYSAG